MSLLLLLPDVLGEERSSTRSPKTAHNARCVLCAIPMRRAEQLPPTRHARTSVPQSTRMPAATHRTHRDSAHTLKARIVRKQTSARLRCPAKFAGLASASRSTANLSHTTRRPGTPPDTCTRRAVPNSLGHCLMSAQTTIRLQACAHIKRIAITRIATRRQWQCSVLARRA